MNIFENINREIARKLPDSSRAELINTPLKQSIVGESVQMIYYNGRDYSRFFPNRSIDLIIGHWWIGGKVSNIRDSFGDDKYFHDVELIAIGAHDNLAIALTAIEKAGARVASFDFRALNIMKTLNVDAKTQFPELTAFSIRYTFNSDSDTIDEICEPCQK